ncbi:MAG: glutamate racemase [Bacteroidota bacterium]
MRSFDHHIGIFDSGIGGLSVANAVYGLLPRAVLTYYADTAHVPYGPRPRAEILAFSERITRFLLDRGAQLIVVACNTATAAALPALRKQWPKIPFVGMEPAVKPAAAATRTGKVGVLATQSTIQSERYAQLMARYAGTVEVLENPCIGLVPQIEAGELQTSATRTLLTQIVQPMLAAGVDTLVLGCTHYPFILPLLREIVGPQVQLIDPAPAVARQVARRLQGIVTTDNQQMAHQFIASGAYSALATYTDIPFVECAG